MKETDDNKNAETGDNIRYNNIPNNKNGETIKITEATKRRLRRIAVFQFMSYILSVIPERDVDSADKRSRNVIQECRNSCQKHEHDYLKN